MSFVLRRRLAGGWRAGLALIVVVALLVGVTIISILDRAPSGGQQPSDDLAPSPGISGLGGSLGPTQSIGAAPSTQSTGLSSLPPSPASQPSAPHVATRQVWWIILENHEYGSIIDNPQAPYLNGLAARYGLATNYYATSHPSEPNYVALVAGSTLGVVSDGVYHLQAPSLFSQLQAAGRTWRVYAQDDQTGCFTGTSAGGGSDGPGAPGTYARKHNPAISFTSVAGSSAQCRNIEPLRAFDPAAGVFEMIVPNLTNDMHDGTIAQGDAFLRAFVPGIVASPAFRAGGVLFITFDEGSTNAGSLGDGGGHVATLIIASAISPGYRDRAYADHWALLRTTEEVLGLPCLADSCRSTLIGY
jgi:phosphatidylinositol-3-phosphatase